MEQPSARWIGLLLSALLVTGCAAQGPATDASALASIVTEASVGASDPEAEPSDASASAPAASTAPVAAGDLLELAEFLAPPTGTETERLENDGVVLMRWTTTETRGDLEAHYNGITAGNGFVVYANLTEAVSTWIFSENGIVPGSGSIQVTPSGDGLLVTVTLAPGA